MPHILSGQEGLMASPNGLSRNTYTTPLGGAPVVQVSLYGTLRLFHAAKGHMGGLPLH
jgi:hypothetical protein